MKKYEFTGETKEANNTVLRRIRRLSDGCVGGWIETEDNLSHEGQSFVYDTAMVWGSARILNNAVVSGQASVSGQAKISGEARIMGNAKVFDHTRIFGDAHVFEDAQVSAPVSSGIACLWPGGRPSKRESIWQCPRP